MLNSSIGSSDGPSSIAKSRWLRGNLPAATLVCVLIALVYSQVGITHQDDWMSNPDLVEQVYPWFQLQASALSRGELPLWNPFQWGGQPLPGQVQPGTAYPLNWLLFLLPQRDGLIGYRFLDWYFILIHCFAGVAAFALCRGLNTSRLAAVVGGLLFSLGGYVGRVDWPQMLNGAAWVPLVLLALLRGPETARPWTAVAWGGVSLGMAWLAGHHQVPLFVTLTVATLWLWRILQQWPRCRLPVAHAALFFLTAGLTSALQMIPAWEYGRHAARFVGAGIPLAWKDTVPYSVHAALSSRPHRLLGIVFPNILDQYDHYLGFVGLSLGILAVVSFWNRAGDTGAAREAHTRVLSTMAVLAVFLSLGAHTALHGILYALLPVVEKARTPAAFSAIFSVAGATLAAFGVDALRQRVSEPFLRVLSLVLAISGGVLFVGAALLFYGSSTVFPFEDRFVLSALVALLLAAMLRAWVSRGPATPALAGPATDARTKPAFSLSPAYLAAGLLTLLVVELSMSTLEPLVPKADLAKRSAYRERLAHRDVADYLRRQPLGSRAELRPDDLGGALADIHQVPIFQGSTASVPATLWDLRLATPRVLQLYGVSTYIGSQAPVLPDGSTLQAEPVANFENGLKAWALPGALPRVWIAHRAEAVANAEELRQRLNEPDRDLRKSALFVGMAPALPRCPENGIEEEASIAEYRMNRLVLDVRAACPALVVLSDNLFPGWQATVDGKPAELLPAYHALRGVLVGSGTHRIEMHYAPASVFWGAALSALGIILGTIVALVERRGARQNAQR